MCLYLCHKYMMFHYVVRTVEVYVCLFQSCFVKLTFHELHIGISTWLPLRTSWNLSFCERFWLHRRHTATSRGAQRGTFRHKKSSHCGRPSRALRHLKWLTTRRLPKWCLVISMKVEISYVFFNVFDSFDGKIQLYDIVTDPFVSCCMEPRCSEHSLVLDGTEFPSETQGLQNPLNLLKYLHTTTTIDPKNTQRESQFRKFCLWSLELAIFFEWVSHVSQKRPPTIAGMLNSKKVSILWYRQMERYKGSLRILTLQKMAILRT